jgi:2-dehydropantoate 2-reductase
MKIAVMGTGGVGGYFGAHLAKTNEVAFIARGAHLDAMRANGLTITGARGDIALDSVDATDDPAAIGPVDVVLFCVKLYDTDSAGAAIAPMVGPETRVLPLQNGIEGPERLAERFGPDRVLAGAAYVAATIIEPAVIRYTSDMSKIVFGPMKGGADAFATRFAETCREAGFDAEASENVAPLLWKKLMLLAANAGVSSASRQPPRAIYDDPETRSVALDAMREVRAVAAARGVEIEPGAEEELAALCDTYPMDLYPSMYHDLIRGRRMELDGLAGYVMRQGAAHGVPTPVNRTLYAALKAYKDGGQPSGL